MGQLAQDDGFAAHLAAVGNELAVGCNDADIGGPVGDRPGVGRRELDVEIGDHRGGGDAAPEADEEQPVDERQHHAPEGEGLALAAAADLLDLLALRLLGRLAAGARSTRGWSSR